MEYDYDKDGPLMSRRCLFTNYDRVHAMNAEELAEFLKGCGVSCPDGHFAGDYECHDCKDCWLDWLRQEADT